MKKKPKKRIGNLSDAKSFERQITKITGKERDILLIGEDMDIIDYTLAKCCNPIEGDDVFGFVTSQEGIKIHRTNCPNAIELMSKHGHRVVKARWASQKIGYFLVGLRLRGTDRVGIVNDVTKIISNELKVNMKSVSIETVDGIFEGNLKIYIQNTEHLERLMERLQKVEGVEQVSRFDL